MIGKFQHTAARRRLGGQPSRRRAQGQEAAGRQQIGRPHHHRHRAGPPQRRRRAVAARPAPASIERAGRAGRYLFPDGTQICGRARQADANHPHP